jgi:hypothetical protein
MANENNGGENMSKAKRKLGENSMAKRKSSYSMKKTVM